MVVHTNHSDESDEKMQADKSVQCAKSVLGCAKSVLGCTKSVQKVCWDVQRGCWGVHICKECARICISVQAESEDVKRCTEMVCMQTSCQFRHLSKFCHIGHHILAQ